MEALPVLDAPEVVTLEVAFVVEAAELVDLLLLALVVVPPLRA
ncbi:hypothetical protein HPL003_04640 [Paenibacillus terrae HPL-003]|uniref:Uncharacterized protein n=1 Tax=Paenibacillus terrae (strain HPL-003) TaxID=985665 RepID=G7VVQ6_PAETH|nr:hypothetical protein HPL003_04640 [Paenibacillus terrae HPL-003]